MGKDNLRIHFIYVVTGLILTVIFLLAADLSQVSALADKFEFALGLASLILAVVAIIYAFFSNSSLTGVISSVSALLSRTEQATGDLASLTQKLEGKMSMNLEALERVETGTKDIKDNIKALSTKSASQLRNNQPDQDVGDDDVRRFMDGCSIAALVLCYYLYVCQEKRMTLDLGRFSQIHDLLDISYSHGFIVATFCAGFIQYENESTRFFNIDINDSIGEQAKDKFIERVRERFSDNEELRDELLAVVDNPIDKLIMEDQQTQDLAGES